MTTTIAARWPRTARAICCWALIEAATHACRHPHYRERYRRIKQRLGKQRGAKIARVELARELATAIWWMLSKNEPFAPAVRRPVAEAAA